VIEVVCVPPFLPQKAELDINYDNLNVPKMLEKIVS